jgi:hypothetical protein
VGQIDVNQTSTPSGLYPGGSAQALSGNFDNNAAQPVAVESVTVSLDSITGAGTTSLGCTTDDFVLSATSAGSATDNLDGTFTITFDPGQNLTASTNNQGSWSGVSVAMKNTAANQDDCKSATVHLAYVAS